MSTPDHLRYDSLEAWAEGIHLPKDWTRHPDTKQLGLWWAQYAKLKHHLWSQHIARLSDEEQKQFRDRTHPSLSHKFQERAQPFTTALQEELARLGYTAQVKLGFYHMDRIVLSAALDCTPLGRLRGVPWLFRGFEIKYHFPDSSTHKA